MISVILIGISLSLDAFAVSVSSGISIRGLRLFYMLRASFFFGFFQFLMPVIGWFLGKRLISYISAYDHWIAFALLAFIGGKMLKEALESKKAGASQPTEGGDIRSLGTLLTLTVATSIDALAVGLSFSILGRGIWGPAALFGLITAPVCLLGFEFGRRVGALFEKGAQIVGGFILIGIGAKILLEHLLSG
ncbi:MAG: manganese efflux pump MntP family protein, partial [Treponema sp.]|jgi:putative Mn2+ efflux pump MntP|nr:manganese efflux pump MntP family protein [Treponema sp.]